VSRCLRPPTRAGLGIRALQQVRGRNATVAGLVVLAACCWSMTASAQLDSLLFIKRVPPTVIIAFDNSLSMMEDGNGGFYDTNTYSVADDPAAAVAFGLDTALHTTYRRKYIGLQYEAIQDSSRKWQAADIVAVPNTAADYGNFWNNTRFETAKQGLELAIRQNASSMFRWGLVKQRQYSPEWRIAPDCDRPVRVMSGSTALMNGADSNPCQAGSAGKYGIYAPSVDVPDYGIETVTAAVVPAAGGTSSAVLSKVTPWRPAGSLQPASYATVTGGNGIIPASHGESGFRDRPLSHLLDDARAEAARAMAADAAATRSCRNTVVVLIASGRESGSSTYMGSHSAGQVASSFMAVSSGGVTRRVPIYVIGVKLSSADADALSPIAANSGGSYVSVNSAAEVAAAVNRAVQAGFARATDFDAGRNSEFEAVSPIVGTVNLKNAPDASGTLLPDTDIFAIPGAQPLPQRSNMILTAGFALPGFDGRIRAFRTYKPVQDSTKPTGWKFVSDGTRLWPDLDGRPEYAGLARTPANPDTRNIYTFIPNGSGGGSVVPFTVGNAVALASHMNAGSDPTALISFVRSQPIGAIIGSTPALMDPPSLDPPPDEAYGRRDAPGSFAGDHKDRRSMIFVGANDGMIHAIDARTGYEVWAFIPYNLLPKLRALADGQAVELFDYFVDSSPKIAEVKIGGAWRSVIIIGEGPGGTFYQSFDVTEAGMGVDPATGDLGAVNALLSRFDTPNESIQFKWAFPNYSSFNPAYTASFNVNDATPGGKITLYGDLKSTAPYAEKTVGFTWSDPAVGTLDRDRTLTAVMIGSGYFPEIEPMIPGRGAAGPRAGNAIYALNVDTGQLIGNPTGAVCPQIAADSGVGTGCASIGDVAGNGRKNALQADPTAAGDGGSYIVNRAYVGDIDGRYWRFNFTPAGQISANLMLDTGSPIYASSALLFIGSMDVYMFFATGSDILPSTASGGTGTFKLYGLKDNFPATSATTKFARNLAAVSNTNGLATGERPSTAPSVAGDIVFYTTTTESASTPCSDFAAKLYALTYVGGAAYDSDLDARIGNNESPVVKTVAGRATAPFIVDQHLYFGSTAVSGANVEAFGDPEDFNNGIGQVGVRILSWREIR
jgi:hypothetical protein